VFADGDARVAQFRCFRRIAIRAVRRMKVGGQTLLRLYVDRGEGNAPLRID
jgi:hypothetical protein